MAHTEFFNFVILFLNSQTQAKFDEQTQKKNLNEAIQVIRNTIEADILPLRNDEKCYIP
ncbi:hypothetical protein [Coxiella-like endosymbiont]|uniref:hypothetical protein n=1 Tax=Coxiella-like endosymbiont TaxID=1592897 RepID=UPI00272BBB56|nr:hypothetical protein [Coxiella-like endosymbiont]